MVKIKIFDVYYKAYLSYEYGGCEKKEKNSGGEVRGKYKNKWK
jgi:hypothetical protein